MPLLVTIKPILLSLKPIPAGAIYADYGPCSTPIGKHAKKAPENCFINPVLKQVAICASEATQNRTGRSPGSERGAPLPKARATRKIDLAKPEQADCHLFEYRVNNLTTTQDLFSCD